MSDTIYQESIEFENSFKEAKIIMLEFWEFENLKTTLEQKGVDMTYTKDEVIAFGCNISGNPFIIVNEDNFIDFNKDEKRVILAHEAAHAIANILDEEEADLWALDALNETQKNILIDMWEDRHGHTYEERVK